MPRLTFYTGTIPPTQQPGFRIPPSRYLPPPPPFFPPYYPYQQPFPLGGPRFTDLDRPQLPPQYGYPSSSNYTPSDHPEQLRKVRVPGDGRCLYRAIAYGLAHSNGVRLSKREQTNEADRLRTLAHDTIRWKLKEEFRQNHVIEGDIEEYCDCMQDVSFYGGEAEIIALSYALKSSIAVYVDCKTGLKRINVYGQRRRVRHSISVLFNGHNHYDALVEC